MTQQRIAIVVLAAVIMSCAESTAPALSPPAVSGVSIIEPGGAIFRSLQVELDRAGIVEVDYWTEGSPRLRVASQQASETPVVRLPRLRANASYLYTVTPIGPFGALGMTVDGEFHTGPLPQAFAEFKAHTVGEPTFPLVMLEVVGPNVTDAPIVIDRRGNIVWYRDGAATAAAGVAVLSNGNLALSVAEGINVLTPDNQLVARLNETDAAARTGLGRFQIHHDVIATPDDKLLFLVQDTATVADTVWTGEAIWEWDFTQDVLSKRWTAFDFMSPKTDRGARSVPNDWLHANSLSLGPRGNVVVSFFWTHEVVSIAPDFQSFDWRLGGEHSTFVVADGAMDAGQHTAAEVATDRVLLFDNGLDRPGGALFSRALELEINRESQNAQIAWEFRPYPDIYAPILGSARRLDNGNTVVTFGVSAGITNPPSSGPIAVYEVSPTKTVWLMHLEGVNQVYRATPMNSLGGETELADSQLRR